MIWETINELTNSKTKINTSVSSVMHNNQTKTTPHEISNAFNDYFSHIAPELAHKVPPTQMSHKSYLRGDYPCSMSVPIITDYDTAKVISSLKNKKKYTLMRFQLTS